MKKYFCFGIQQYGEIVKVDSGNEKINNKIIIDTGNKKIKNVNAFFEEIIVVSFMDEKYPYIEFEKGDDLKDHTNEDIAKLVENIVGKINAKTEKMIEEYESSTT